MCMSTYKGSKTLELPEASTQWVIKRKMKLIGSWIEHLSGAMLFIDSFGN